MLIHLLILASINYIPYKLGWFVGVWGRGREIGGGGEVAETALFRQELSSDSIARLERHLFKVKKSF